MAAVKVAVVNAETSAEDAQNWAYAAETAATNAQQGVDALLNRKVNAGAGLSGGGNLTSDVGLAVAFGGNGTAPAASRADHTHPLPVAAAIAGTCTARTGWVVNTVTPLRAGGATGICLEVTPNTDAGVGVHTPATADASLRNVLPWGRFAGSWYGLGSANNGGGAMIDRASGIIYVATPSVIPGGSPINISFTFPGK